MKSLQNKLKSIPWLRILLLVLLVSGFSCSPVMGQSINWKTYAAGVREAKETNKKIFLHFMTQWCGYCKRMNQITFKDDGVIEYLNQHFVSIKVDGDREKALTGEYKVTGYPDNRFLEPDMEQAYRVPGFADPMAFRFFMEYVHTDSYKTMGPMEYYRSKQ